AAVAERRAEPRQPVGAPAAEDRAAGPAAKAALREQEVEHTPKLAAGRRLLRAGFAPSLPRPDDGVGIPELVVVADVEPFAVDAVAVDGLARLQPRDEPAGLIRRVALVEIALDEPEVLAVEEVRRG